MTLTESPKSVVRTDNSSAKAFRSNPKVIRDIQIVRKSTSPNNILPSSYEPASVTKEYAAINQDSPGYATKDPLRLKVDAKSILIPVCMKSGSQACRAPPIISKADSENTRSRANHHVRRKYSETCQKLKFAPQTVREQQSPKTFKELTIFGSSKTIGNQPNNGFEITTSVQTSGDKPGLTQEKSVEARIFRQESRDLIDSILIDKIQREIANTEQPLFLVKKISQKPVTPCKVKIEAYNTYANAQSTKNDALWELNNAEEKIPYMTNTVVAQKLLVRKSTGASCRSRPLSRLRFEGDTFQLSKKTYSIPSDHLAFADRKLSSEQSFRRSFSQKRPQSRPGSKRSIRQNSFMLGFRFLINKRRQ